VISPVAVLGGALMVDGCFGEPPARLHPVVWMGRVATWVERATFRGGRVRQLSTGLVVAFALPGCFAAGAGWLLALSQRWPIAEIVTGVWLLKSTFALRALGRAAREVGEALRRADLAAARHGLRSLCSRDPATLTAPALVAATIESVAENASDSFVAPLFYFAVFGIPGAMFYRAVNTLDAMIGYRGRYEYYGKAAARLDDLLNFIPARATALAILIAGKLGGRDARRGARTMLRDRAKTASPNAGWPMAAMAGLLGVELAKDGHYRLGEPLEALDPGQIQAAWRIAAGAGLIASAAVGLVLLLGSRHGA
jgi:adenosylcobinamide-phosphate synthase